MPIPNHPFEQIAIDTCGPFVKTGNGNQYIITVVDMFTGYIESKCVPTKTAEEVARFLTDEIIPRHSVPKSILTDRGTEYCNKVIEYITKSLGVCHIRTSPYNPNANGRCERTHRVLSQCLTKLVGLDQDNWDQYVNAFTGAYNCADHTNTGFSPFRLLYNRQPVYPVDTLLHDREKYHGEEFGPQAVERLHAVFRVVRSNLASQAKANRERHNRKVKSEDIEVGDAVYVYNHRRSGKLQPRWLTGYVVTKKTGEHTYRLQNQNTQDVSVQHGRNLRKASPNDELLRPHGRENVRKARLVMPPDDSDESSSERSVTETDESSDDEEDNIPLAQLRNRLSGAAQNRTVPYRRRRPERTVPIGDVQCQGQGHDPRITRRNPPPGTYTSTYHAGPITPQGGGMGAPRRKVPNRPRGGTTWIPHDYDVGEDAPNVDIQNDATCDRNEGPGPSGSQGVQQDDSGNVDMGGPDHTSAGISDPTPTTNASARPNFNLRGRTVYKNVVPRKGNETRTSVRESLEDSRKESKYKLHCANRGLAEDGSELIKECPMDSSVNRKRTHADESTSEEDIIPDKKILIGALTKYVQSLQAKIEGLDEQVRLDDLTNVIGDTAEDLCKLRMRSQEISGK